MRICGLNVSNINKTINKSLRKISNIYDSLSPTPAKKRAIKQPQSPTNTFITKFIDFFKNLSSPKEKKIFSQKALNQYCKEKNLSFIRDAEKERIIASFFNNDDFKKVFITGNPDLGRYDVLESAYNLHKCSKETLLSLGYFIEKNLSALKSGKIKELRFSLPELYHIAINTESKNEYDTIYKLLNSDGYKMNYYPDIKHIMKNLKTPMERHIIVKYTNKGKHMPSVYSLSIYHASKEIENFRIKNNRSMNLRELKIFEEYLDAISHRTIADTSYNGDFIHELIPITTDKNKETIIKILKSHFILHTTHPKHNDTNNGIIELLKYQQKNQDIPEIISFATNPNRKLQNFHSVVTYFDFVKNHKDNPLMSKVMSNISLNPGETEIIFHEINANPDLLKIFGKNITEGSFGYLSFLTKMIKKYPQTKDSLIFQAKLPENYICDKTSDTALTNLNKKLQQKIYNLCDTPQKIKAINSLLDKSKEINWASFTNEDINKKQANTIIENLYEIISSQQRLQSRQYKTSHLWAIKTKTLTDYAALEIKSQKGFKSVLNDIAKNYASCFRDVHNKRGQRRIYGLITTYDDRNYIEYKQSLDSLYGRYREAPFKDIELTQISKTYATSPPANAMIHPPSTNIDKAITEANKYYESILKCIEKKSNGIKLTPEELFQAEDNIATIHYIISNTAPYCRGSAAIAGIMTRSLYKALGIECGATKRNIALDLEAFCNTLPEYLKKWHTFFEINP